MQCLLVISILLVLVTCSDACFEPEGYKIWDATRVMSITDLLLYVKFISKKIHIHDDTGEGRIYRVKLTAEVLCVVHNRNFVPIPKKVIVSEKRHGSIKNWENPCIDFSDNIQLKEPVFVMVQPRDDNDMELGFVTLNIQGPYFYPKDFDLKKFMKGCDNIKPEAPTGGGDDSCPLKPGATKNDCIDLKVSSASSLIPLKAALLAGLMVIFRILL